MGVLELKEKRIILKNELKSLISNGEAEKRELREDENTKMDELRTQIDSIDEEIRKIESEDEKLAKEAQNNKENKTERNMKFNLGKLVREIADNQISEESRQFINGNTINYRAAIQATATGNGEEIVPEQKDPLFVAVRNASVLGKMNAHFYNNLVGNLSIPKYTGSSAEWADTENAAAVSGEGTTSEVILSPKRLTSVIKVSRQALVQSNDDLEATLIADLSRALGEKLDMTIFGAQSGTTARPAGLFYDADITGTTLTAATYDDVLALEEAIELKNANDYVFVADVKAKQHFRGVQEASGLAFAFDKGELDGRKCYVSNSVNAKSVLAIVPEDLCVGTWDLNILVDPYTLSDQNMIRIVANYLVDAKMKSDRIATEVFA